MTMIKKEITDKVEGFRVSDEVSKKLKQDLFRTDKTKKEWLENRVEQLENLHKVKNKPDEKWTMVPNSELEHLHSGYPDHFEFIHQRILEHCIQQKLEITFDNLLLDCIYFYNYNDIKYLRYQDEACTDMCSDTSCPCCKQPVEVLVIEHNVGMNYSEFTSKLLCKFIDVTDQYDLVSTQTSENKFIIKFQKHTFLRSESLKDATFK